MKEFAQGHTAGKQQGWDLNTGEGLRKDGAILPLSGALGG